MTWRGTNTVQERVFGVLPYLLPLIDLIALQYISPFPPGSLMNLIPGWGLLMRLVFPLLAIYYSSWIISLGIFFALFALVIRNENIARFIRFNAMQAILIGIVLTLIRLVRDYLLGPALTATGESGLFILDTLQNTILMGTLAALIYCFVQVVRGIYPDKIPSLSDIVNMQVR